MTREPAALLEQLEAGRNRFLSFLRARLPDADSAEEVLQESLLHALEAAPALRSRDSLVPWFYTILRNAVTDYYRRRARDSSRLDRTFPEELASEDEGHAELCECFVPIIDTLKPEYAQLIRLLDLEGEEPAILARSLGVTPANLKVRRHRARQALRRRLQETCRICAEHHCLDCSCREDAILS